MELKSQKLITLQIYPFKIAIEFQPHKYLDESAILWLTAEKKQMRKGILSNLHPIAVPFYHAFIHLPSPFDTWF